MALLRSAPKTAIRSAAPLWDPAIYERERERVFGHAWLFVGHEAMIPKPGDYVTNTMGDDPVILCRDKDGAMHVLLNRCRHRGNKVCLYDKGNAKSFRCSYHGWTYATSGELSGVPLLAEAYGSDFRREEWGLLEVPSIAEYRGMIFASWDPNIQPLTDYLGDAKWYLDCFGLDDPEGYEVLPGCHRFMASVNWKLICENFGGDTYHFPITHASVGVLSRRGQVDRRAQSPRYSIDIVGEGHPPHGFQAFTVGEEHLAADLEPAERLSPAAVEWVKERYRRRQALCGGHSVHPYAFQAGNIWPNLSINGFGLALYGRSILQCHPRGPESTEIVHWALIEKSAPPEVKERMAFNMTWRHSVTGMVTPDDLDNFDRIRSVLHTSQGRHLDFNYELSQASDSTSLIPDLPGRVRPEASESYQRAFYRYWDEVMDAEAPR